MYIYIFSLADLHPAQPERGAGWGCWLYVFVWKLHVLVPSGNPFSALLPVGFGDRALQQPCLSLVSRSSMIYFSLTHSLFATVSRNVSYVLNHSNWRKHPGKSNGKSSYPSTPLKTLNTNGHISASSSFSRSTTATTCVLAMSSTICCSPKYFPLSHC